MLHGLVTWKWTDRPTRESTCIKHTKVLILSPSSKALIGPKFFIGLFLKSLSWAVSIFLYRDPRLNCRVLSLSPFHIRGYTDFVSFRITFKMSFVFSLTSRIAQVQGQMYRVHLQIALTSKWKSNEIDVTWSAFDWHWLVAAAASW